MGLSSTDKKELRQYLCSHFDLEELKTLAFDINVAYDAFSHDRISVFSRELISYCERHSRLYDLLVEVINTYHDPGITDMLAKVPPPNQELIKAQIILPHGVLDNLSDFLRAMADLLGCKPDEIKIIAAAEGSMRLLVSFPPHRWLVLGTPLTPNKYEISEITDFYALSPADQRTWQYLAIYYPPIKRRKSLRSSISWMEARSNSAKGFVPTKAPSLLSQLKYAINNLLKPNNPLSVLTSFAVMTILIFFGVALLFIMFNPLPEIITSQPTATNTPIVTSTPTSTIPSVDTTDPPPTIVETLNTPTPNISTPNILTPTISPTQPPVVATSKAIISPFLNLPGRVFWDISHYQDSDREAEPDIALYWVDKYTTLQFALANRGMENVFSSRTVLQDDLSEYGLLIINLSWSWQQAYSPEEAMAVFNFVRRGGTLILIGDHEGTPNENLSAITSLLGVETGGSWNIGTNVDGLEHLRVFTDHAIFDGITDIILDYWGGELTITNDRYVVATGANTDGQIAIAALEIGAGKVIVLGDMAIWHDTEIASTENQEQNYQFLHNTLDWMLTKQAN